MKTNDKGEFVLSNEETDKLNEALATFKALFKKTGLGSIAYPSDKECNITVSIQWKRQDYN